MSLPVQTDLLVWLRADAGLYQDRNAHTTPATADGDLVGTWADQTANGRDVSPDVNLNRPTLKTSIINGQSVLRFNGSSTYLAFALNAFSGVSAAEGFIIVKKTGNADTKGFWYAGQDTAQSHHRYSDNHIYDAFFTTSRKDVGTGGPDFSAAFILYNVISVSAEWTLNVNGTQVFTTATNTAGPNTNAAVGTGTGNSGNPLGGDIAEFFVYNRKLTNAERSYVGGYIQSRYAITIAGSANPINLRNTQEPVRTLLLPTDANLRNSQEPVRTLLLPSDAKLRNSQEPVRTLLLPTDAKLRNTQEVLRVLKQGHPTTIVSGLPIGANATGHGNQSHLVYAANQQRWWLFTLKLVSNTSIASYVSSTNDLNTATWSQSTSSPVFPSSETLSANDGRNFGCLNVTNGTTDALHISASMIDSTDLLHIRATFTGASSITWESWNDFSPSGNTTPGGNALGISTPSKFIHEVGCNLVGLANPGARVSTNPDTGATWTTGFGATTSLKTTALGSNSYGIAPLASDGMVVVYEDGGGGNNSNGLNYSKFSGTWTAASGSTTGNGTTVQDQNDWCLCGVDTTHVYSIRRSGSNTFDWRVFDGTAWATPANGIPNQNHQDGSGLFAATNGSSLWLFLLDSAAGQPIWYNKASNASTTPTWGTWTQLDDGDSVRNFISGYPAIGNNQVGIIYTVARGSNIDVQVTVLAGIPAANSAAAVLQDVISVNSTCTVSKGVSANIADVITLSTSPIITAKVSADIADIISLNAITSAFITASADLHDIITLTASASSTIGAVATITGNIDVLATPTLTSVISTSIEEAISVIANITGNIDVSAFVEEVVTVNANAQKINNASVVIADTISVNATLTAFQVQTLDAALSMVVTVSAAPFITARVITAIRDVTSVNATLGKLRLAIANIAQKVTVLAHALKTLYISANLADNVTVLARALKRQYISATLVDNITLTGNVHRIAHGISPISDQVTVSASAQHTHSIACAVRDQVTVNAVPLKRLNASASLADIVTVNPRPHITHRTPVEASCIISLSAVPYLKQTSPVACRAIVTVTAAPVISLKRISTLIKLVDTVLAAPVIRMPVSLALADVVSVNVGMTMGVLTRILGRTEITSALLGQHFITPGT